ncbi:MAG: hypothetical protein RTU92_07245, partial [Candidatus Thorarchaeota archaeon]
SANTWYSGHWIEGSLFFDDSEYWTYNPSLETVTINPVRFKTADLTGDSTSDTIDIAWVRGIVRTNPI